MTCTRLCWRSEHHGGTPLSVVRHRVTVGGYGAAHDHDFLEAFWIESGRLEHRFSGHPAQVLEPGDLQCVRAGDAHAFAACAPGPAVLVNVSFPAAAAAPAAALAGAAWPWRPGPPPAPVRLPPARRERLHAWAEELAAPGRDALDLAAFLLDVTRLAARPGRPAAGDGLPPWLRDAVEVFADPLHLAGGAPRLAHLAGRSLAHVNRTIHAAQGRTATTLVNALRLEWAAARLRLGGEPVAEVAAACGLANLSHFYALFRARYGATPHRYRADAGRLTQNEVEEIAKTPSRQGSRR